MGYSTVRRIMREGLTDPRNLDGIALWNSTRDVTDMTVDTGIKLWRDKSGNSGVNVLCLNGVAGNYASAPDSVPLSITGDLDLQACVSLADWTPGTTQDILTKWNTTGNQRSYNFQVFTSGVLILNWSTNGTNTPFEVSSVAPTVSDFGRLWIRATLDVDNGAAGYTVTFYTGGSGETPTWVQLGTAKTTAGVTSVFDGTATLNVGSRDAGASGNSTGNFHRVRVYSGLTESDLRFDANFATFSKLAASGTESSSNAATVTINTSGATGARISGARDLYQGTAANQPILTIAAAGNYLTFDGSNDYLKAAAFALAQPETVYLVGSQVTWTSNDRIWCGDGSAVMQLEQITSTPTVFLRSSSGTDSTNTWALATNAVVSAVYNGAASFLRINRATAIGPSTNATVGNGFTLGAQGSGLNPANITASEVLVYSTAQDENYQYRVTRLLSRRTGVNVV